jgi:replication factor A1
MVMLSGFFKKKSLNCSYNLMLFQDNSGTAIWRGIHLNNRKPVLGEQLAFFSVKHGVYLRELFGAVVQARTTGKAVCQDLTIEYRGSVDDKAIILITKDDKVVVQFRATEELLLKKHIAFETWMDTDQVRRQMTKQDKAPNGRSRIQDLRHGMKKVSVEAEVIEIADPVSVHTQWGNNVMLTNAVIADHTGKIKLCLWNEQAGLIKLGDALQIENGSVKNFRGERQLTLRKKGTINVMQSGIPNVKHDFEESPRNMLYA